MTMKECSLCKKELHLDQFHRNASKPNGVASQCKECRKLEGKTSRAIEYRRERWAGNKDRLSENYRKWAKKNPDKKRVANSRRRALIRGQAQIGFIPELSEIVGWYKKGCLYPGCENKNASLDHVIPLSKGGEHALYNIQPLCQHHNYSKKDRTADYRGRRVLIAIVQGPPCSS